MSLSIGRSAMASMGQPSLVKIANTALPGSCGVHPQRVDSASTTSRPRPCSAPAAGWRLTGGSGQGSVTTTTTAPEPSRRSSSRSNARALACAIALLTSSEVTVRRPR